MDMLTAAKYGNITHIKKLLQQGMKVDQTRERNGDTALHVAVRYGQLDTIKFLLKNGADINAQNMYGGKPIHKALRWGHDSVVQLLAKKGADVSILQQFGDTKLHRAARNGHPEIVKLHIDNGDEINKTNLFGDTALHRAAWNGHLEIVKCLLEHGADPSIQNNDGDTAWSLALQHGFHHITQYMATQDHQKELSTVVTKMSFMLDDKYRNIKTHKQKKDALETKLKEKEKEHGDIHQEIHKTKKQLEELYARNKKVKENIESIEVELLAEKDIIIECEREIANVKSFTLTKRNQSSPKNDLEDDLSCPICMEVPLPPRKVFQCKEGHVFCDVCKKSLKQCPECRVDIRNTCIRSRRLEEIILKVFGESKTNSSPPPPKTSPPTPTRPPPPRLSNVNNKSTSSPTISTTRSQTALEASV